MTYSASPHTRNSTGTVTCNTGQVHPSMQLVQCDFSGFITHHSICHTWHRRYVLIGQAQLTCISTGPLTSAWNDTAGYCRLPDDCTAVFIDNGTYAYSDTYMSRTSTATPTCNLGYSLASPVLVAPLLTTAQPTNPTESC